ncbi:MAG: hypothetical protein ACRD2F_04720 [Terriglobales bacterium]
MPRRDEHLKIAQENAYFRAGMDPANGTARGWVATVAFYEAIHLVEAFFATHYVHSPDHRTRDSSLVKFRETKEIYDDFSELKNLSLSARYWGRYPADGDIAAVVEPSLNTVRDRMRRAMKLP